MFVVIFKAITNVQDAHYQQTVSIMRDLAFTQYNCQDFLAVTDDKQEIAISYWLSEDDIRAWHADSQHAVAQKLGQDKWYQSYSVEVAQITRSYQMP